MKPLSKRISPFLVRLFLLPLLLIAFFCLPAVSYSFYTTNCSMDFEVKRVYDKNDPVNVPTRTRKPLKDVAFLNSLDHPIE